VVKWGERKPDPTEERLKAEARLRQRGQLFRKNRERLGLTRHQLAKMLRTHSSCVRNWEDGKTQPYRRWQMEALLCVLGLRLDELN
jgi:DNA-binding transcriptional regulator YiaG